jgi:hypothetical protein
MNEGLRRIVSFLVIVTFSPWSALAETPQVAKGNRETAACGESIAAAERIRVYSIEDEGIVWEFHQDKFSWELEDGSLRVSERDCAGCEPQRFGPGTQLRIGTGNHQSYGTAMGAVFGLAVPGVLLALNDGDGGGETPGVGVGWTLMIFSSVLTGAILGNIIGRGVPRWTRCEIR